MRIHLLLTGNEIMSGDTVDTNSAYMAQQLALQGWEVEKKVTVADHLDQLVAEIQACCREADVLIINGGLGPTVDDLTAQAMAAACSQTLVYHEQALAHIDQWCKQRGFEPNEANLKQALLPEQAQIIPNRRGSAVGIQMQLNNCWMMATPGVPSEMRQMMDDSLIPFLCAQFESDRVEVRRLAVFGLGESGRQQSIREHIPEWPAEIDLGFRASMPLLEVKLTAKGDACAELDLWQQKVSSLLGDSLIGRAPITMAEQCLRVAKQHNITLASAESCTGGRIAAQLTAVPGSSESFLGAIVSYHNDIKSGLLGVPQSLLENEGAVSEACALMMLKGLFQQTGANAGVAVTGIAGPGGGSPEKPVGTVWIAWGTSDDHQAASFRLPFDRNMFQEYCSALALDLLRRQLAGLDRMPRFLKRWSERQNQSKTAAAG